MLPRILEPELMNSAEDACEYDTMDHSVVNTRFVTDLLAAIGNWSLPHPERTAPARDYLRILDLGAGTAQIPIEIARRAPNYEVAAVDAAGSMLDIARTNIEAADVDNRIELLLADAKDLPFEAYSFPVVVSNSIVHHIAHPQTVVAEAIRVTASCGLHFHRDLARPAGEAELQRLVDTYATEGTSYQRKLFADSLRAALTLDEVRNLVASFGFSADTVQMTSDRHWTWTAIRNG